ncbi:hypothetical protein ACHWQZ_G007522 [Mnemiopsis leidyi]
MDVVNPCAALLSNYEVYLILKETRAEQKKIRNNFAKANLRNLSTIAYETLKYFENLSPCRFSSENIIPDFVRSVKEYNLSKSELVQLINMRPTTHVELHAIIEECEDRYSENQIAALLDVIKVHLHKNIRVRTSDSVSSYLSPTEDVDITSPSTSHILHNSTLSHEEEVVMVDNETLSAEDRQDTTDKKNSRTKNKRKRTKKTSFEKPVVDAELRAEDDDEIDKIRINRKAKAVILSDSEEDGDTLKTLTCDILTDSKMRSLSEETKESNVKLKIKNSSKKFKEKTRRTKENRKVSISNEIDVMNIC